MEFQCARLHVLEVLACAMFVKTFPGVARQGDSARDVAKVTHVRAVLRLIEIER